jgi:hypothetical protein
MAKAVTILKPTNFAELLETIEDFQSKSTVSWYRGCANKSYTLRPSLYRHPTKTSIADLIELETEITTRFVQRSLPFLERTLTDDWDKLFLMQHYGVPTRLLDWSENPFVSIYFALTGGNPSKPADAAIWMCDPVAWNQAVLDHISYRGGVLDQSNTAMRAYAPGTKVDEIPTHPIMIYGSYNSPRIVAQRGGFALFGQGIDSMDKVYRGEKFPDGILKKIEIPSSNVKDIRTSLFRKGFTESVVFPDLEGLSRELRRVFDFQ